MVSLANFRDCGAGLRFKKESLRNFIYLSYSIKYWVKFCFQFCIRQIAGELVSCSKFDCQLEVLELVLRQLHS